LKAAVAAAIGACCCRPAGAASQPATTQSTTRPWPGEIIDIHQHTTYNGRPDDALIHHQKRMGVTHTFLLPSGTSVNTPSTLKGKANGLYAGAGNIDTVIPVVKAHPTEYSFFANEVPDLPNAREHIETWLKRGGIGIGEQKFNLPVDGKDMAMVYELAQEYHVPILMHFQYEQFNTGYERFGNVLKKWPKVTFIGHAMLFWAHIDANCNEKIGYPKGKVKPGGLTDRYLTDYPNFFGDMSAYSGLNAMVRDEDHARAFIDRHQDQLLFGSDCSDRAGFGPTCSGANMIAAILRLSGSDAVRTKLLSGNTRRLFKLDRA
jgi:predicted TIM-barrel fold metal-dependent hydrolase